MDQEGDRNNSYSFDEFIAQRDGFNYYRDDPFLQALVKKYVGNEFDRLHAELGELSDRVSTQHREWADEANLLENRAQITRLKHFDAFNHRIDEIERCAATEQLEREVFELGLFDPSRNTAWSRFCKLFVLYQNGEAGVMCPIACTHGMVNLMQKYEQGDPSLQPEAQALLRWVRDGGGPSGEAGYGRGAQFLTEIQGGSDVNSNLVEAVFEKQEGTDGVSGCWRLHGKKFFCSATQSDVALVTAKPRGTDSATRVALFAVPSWLPGQRESGERNGVTIDRLKQKLGTAELPTAELTYDGAVAYPVGPLDRGLANVAGLVLTLSRLHIALGSAAADLRVAREAAWYARFRTAFGMPIAEFPMLKSQLARLEESARRTAAGTFKMYAEFIAQGEQLHAGLKELNQIEDLEQRRRRFRLRELILLQKIVAAYEAPEIVRLAISVFGGHGIMEDFHAMPRLLRDSFIMELWEGPRNVLLTQVHRDFRRVSEWYPPAEFCAELLAGAAPEIVNPLADRLGRVIGHESLLVSDEQTTAVCEEWERLSSELVHAYQRQALAEVEAG